MRQPVGNQLRQTKACADNPSEGLAVLGPMTATSRSVDASIGGWVERLNFMNA
jgi:hypothetical protein